MGVKEKSCVTVVVLWYADAVSRLIRVEPQVSLGAGETVNGKAKFEDWIWSLAVVLAKHYHSDNGIIASQ